MGDRTFMSIQISEYNWNNLLKKDFNNDEGKFEEEFGIDEVEIDGGIVTFRENEANYGNNDSLEGYLSENNIEYDKFWADGGDYESGEESCRMVKGEWRSIEVSKSQESEQNLIGQFKKLLDQNNLDEVKKIIEEKYKQWFPFEITPIETTKNTSNSVRFIEDSDLSEDYYDNPKTDEDFIQIAKDVYGSSIRDNSKEEQIALGKKYHETGEE